MERTLSNWCLYGPCLTGRIGLDDKFSKTSAIVSRSENKVTTRSGSVYILTDPPHHLMLDEEHLKLYYEASNYFEAIDFVIKDNLTKEH